METEYDMCCSSWNLTHAVENFFFFFEKLHYSVNTTIGPFPVIESQGAKV